jgi:hypothetical protein
VDLLLSLIDKYQKELREKELSLGQRIYEEKPRQFRKRMKGLWQAWQSEPAKQKGVEKQSHKNGQRGKTS